MKESSLWGTMKNNLRTIRGVRVKRIENSCDLGTPDVYLRANGRGAAWIELKYLKEWPKRATTPVRIDHFTDQQRLWLREEGITGGNAWLFVQVGKEYFLFDWPSLPQVGTEWTKADWIFNSRRYWDGGCDWGEFIQITTS